MKTRAIDRLGAAERMVGPRGSLAPGRDRASALEAIGAALISGDAGAEAFAGALIAVAESLAEHFPENIFGDLDHLAARMWAAPDHGVTLAERVVALNAGFGRHGPVRFRYAHDFLFGFDWARWVAKQPEDRRHVGPFDPGFLDYLAQRREELVELIAQDDRKYGRLERGEFRNPFGFSRDPRDERRLHEALAEKDLIPVKTWCLECRPRWEPHYAELREATAASLAIPSRGAHRA